MASFRTAPGLVLLGAFTLVAPPSIAPAGAASTTDGSAASDLDSVVVFADRARVTRTRTTACQQGLARVVFDRLPASLDVRTLRGDVRAPAEVIGLGGDLLNEEGAVDPRARALEAERQKVATEIRAQEARKSSVTAELQAVQGYGGVFGATVSEEMRNPAPNTATWTRTLDALRARRSVLAQRQRTIEIALRTLGREDQRLGRELANQGRGRARATRVATVTVDCRGQGEAVTSLSYVVPGAGWQPEYDLDFSPRERNKTGPGVVRFTVGAVIRQATGEDWNGVRLQLSTARPRLGAEAPEAAPLLITGHEQRQGKVLVQAQERREVLAQGGATAGRGATGAELNDNGNVFVLTLPHRLSVAGDGRPVWAPVDVMTAQATVKLVATPKLDAHVFQVAVLNNPAAYPLLEGRARSYRAGSYIGDARLPYRGVGEPMEISLGVDDELKVQRKTVDQREKAAAFLSSTKHIVSAYRLVLDNRARNTETVELRESIPVSQIDDVKVALIGKLTTAGYQWDARRGFVTWPVQLASGQSRDIDLAYAIALPDSWQVP